MRGPPRSPLASRAIYAIRVSRGSAHEAHIHGYKCGFIGVGYPGTDVGVRVVGVYHRGLARRPRTVLGTVSGHLLLRAERARAGPACNFLCVLFAQHPRLFP